MESRLFLLSLIVVSQALAGCSFFGRGGDEEPVDVNVRTPAVIDPDLDRRDIKPAKIDDENFEVSAYVGIMSIEDFGSDSVFGARMAYHITEDFFMEGAYGSTTAGETSFELLSGAAELLTEEERDFTYYNVSLGYNVFPGEVFLWRERAFNSNFYLIGGVGSTEFAGDERFTANFGAGFRVVATDMFSLRLDVRDHLFDIDLLGEDKTTHNIEYHLGLSIFF